MSVSTVQIALNVPNGGFKLMLHCGACGGQLTVVDLLPLLQFVKAHTHDGQD